MFDRPQHIWVVPADGSSPPEDLTPGEHQFDARAGSPDSAAPRGRRRRHDTWDLDLANDLFPVALDGEPPERLTASDAGRLPRLVVARRRPDRLPRHRRPAERPEEPRVGVLDLATGERRWVGHARPQPRAVPGAQPPLWDGETLLVTVEDRGNVQSARVRARGRGRRAGGRRRRAQRDRLRRRQGDRRLRRHVAHRDAELSAVVDGERAPAHRPRRRLRRAPRRAALRALHRRPRRAGPRSTPGSCTPPDFDPAGSYPALLNIHGGPFTQYGNRFFDEVQLQAGAGYVVVFSNPRGSSGRETRLGSGHRRSELRTDPGTGWGAVDHDDVHGRGRRGPRGATPSIDRGASRRAGRLLRRLHDELDRQPHRPLPGGVLRAGREQPPHARVRVRHRQRVPQPARASTTSTTRGVPAPVAHHLRPRHHHAAAASCTPRTTCAAPSSRPSSCSSPCACSGKEVELVRFPAESHELSRSGSPIHRVQRAEIILEFFDRHLKPRPADDEARTRPSSTTTAPRQAGTSRPADRERNVPRSRDRQTPDARSRSRHGRHIEPTQGPVGRLGVTMADLRPQTGTWNELLDEHGEPRPAAAALVETLRVARAGRAAGPPGPRRPRHPHDGHHVHRVLRRRGHRPGLAVRRDPPGHRRRRVAVGRGRAGAAPRRAQPLHRRPLQRPARSSRDGVVPGRAARRIGRTTARVPRRRTRPSACGPTSAAATSCATPTARCTCSRTTCGCRRA